eukprot:13048_1
MGCACSDPNKTQENSLLAESIHESKSNQNTQRRSNESAADYNEKHSKGMNGYHPNTSASSWYIEPQIKMNENILETLCFLIGDAHKTEIQNAIKSVKTKDDLNEVCQYLIQKSTPVHIKASPQTTHECKVSATSCESTNRMIIVLEAYIKWLKKAESKAGKKGESLYDIVKGQTLGKDIDTTQILNDYHHLLQQHNTDKEFELIFELLRSKQLIISIDESTVIWRHYRDRSVMVNKERKRLYFGHTDSSEVGFIKLMDRIYCHFVYSFDIAMRWRMTERVKLFYAAEDTKQDVDEDGDALVDSQLVCMSSMIKKKQTNLVTILGGQKRKSNKFVSQKDDKRAATFYYKAHQSKSVEKIEMGGKEYEEKDWFIVAKYSSLKEELVERCALSPKIFDDLMVLATWHQSAQQTMEKKNVLALMAYCNHWAIQYELKQTYFRLSDKESDFQWKQRHKALAHLGSLLNEVVAEWGTICDETHVSYHSLSMKSINATLFRFVAPTSTSRSMLVLLNYSSLTLHGKGTMIELRGGKTMNAKSKCFDCSFVSDFGYEEEELFITSQTPLELCSILDGIRLESYALFVFAFGIITTAFGEVNEHWSEDRHDPLHPSDVALSKDKVKKLKKLSKRMLERRAVECQPHLFGNKKRKKRKTSNDDRVLYELVTQFAVAKTEMVLFWFSSSKTIELWPWIDKLLQFMLSSCFCKTLKNNTKWLKLDLLALFFPQLSSLTIADCPITEHMLADIDLFLHKLQMDPADKFKKEAKKRPKPARQESDVFENMGLDLDLLVDQLHSEKSHISFKDPSFDDTCDYRQCAIKEIKILESYEQHEAVQTNSILNKDRVFNKFNKKFAKSGWTLVKAKIMGNHQGFVIQKM